MSRCVRPRQKWGRGQNTRMGGSDPTAPQNRGPVPAGFGGHSRLLLLEFAARVLAARRRSSNGFVRQDVRQNRKGGTKKKHGNHQGTTQTTKISDDTGPSRGVGENPARSIRKIHRLHSVLRYYRSSKNLVQARRRVQNLARPARQRRQPPET